MISRKRISLGVLTCLVAVLALSSCARAPKAPVNFAETVDNGASAIAATENPRIQDWAYTNRYAEHRDTSAVGPKVIFYGDSITECWWMDKEFFLSRGWYERGIGGMTAEQLLVRFRTDVINAHPEYVIILCGINDIAENNGPVDLQITLGSIINMAELAKYNGIIPVLCSLTPCSRFYWRPSAGNPSQTVIAFNEKLRTYCEQSGTMYLDYHSALRNDVDELDPEYTIDGCHLTMKSYKIMEEMVLEVIK